MSAANEKAALTLALSFRPFRARRERALKRGSVVFHSQTFPSPCGRGVRGEGNRGFTLIELVVVIVLLGITAVTFTSLITGSVRGYLDTANRQDSAAMARIALDRIARELREAMPQSVRVTNDKSCIQFLPVNSSFVYAVLNAGDTSVQVVEPPGGYGVPTGSYYAAVYPILPGDLYSTTAMKSISGFGSVSNGLRTLTLASAFTSIHNSPGERLYVVSNLAVSYCFENNGQLNRYTGGVAATQPTPGAGLTSGSGATLIDKLSAGTFNYQSGNWQNNALVTINFTIQQQSSNNETLQFDHEVWLRDVQ